MRVGQPVAEAVAALPVDVPAGESGGELVRADGVPEVSREREEAVLGTERVPARREGVQQRRRGQVGRPRRALTGPALPLQDDRAVPTGSLDQAVTRERVVDLVDRSAGQPEIGRQIADRRQTRPGSDARR